MNRASLKEQLLQKLWPMSPGGTCVFASPEIVACIGFVSWPQAALPDVAAQELSQQHQSAALPAQRPVSRLRHSTFAASSATQKTDGAVALPPPLAAHVYSRSVHDSDSKRRTTAPAYANAPFAVQLRAEVSADTDQQPVSEPREHRLTKTELRARRADRARQQAPAQSRDGMRAAPPTLTAPSALLSLEARQHSDDHTGTCEAAIGHVGHPDQSVPEQPKQPRTMPSGALVSPAQRREGGPSGGKLAALIMTAQGTTIELHQRSVPGSGGDPDGDTVASTNGGAFAARQRPIKEAGCLSRRCRRAKSIQQSLHRCCRCCAPQRVTRQYLWLPH